ncbi:MAG: glycerol-3-phosphate acyltransferase, partial [Dehalococcoidia bacterium]
LLKKDIRDYGDGNPGSFNVFRAGGRKAGALALFLEIGKGFPVVILAYSFFGLTGMSIAVVGISAILGHAFSPLLKFRGGKALAVTGGVILALQLYNIFLVFLFLVFLGFLFIKIDAWTIMFGATGTLIYTIITSGYGWETFFMFCVLIILAIKHINDLHTFPVFEVRVVSFMQARRNKDRSL